ncbi:MAG: ADP-glyceromanno-heptose 6-epimerase [Ignavibacteriaceae bacterium]|nr:ADP-glyceromanno-heptose 6-epimerase [Ignavibacteriaceae bacterium]
MIIVTGGAGFIGSAIVWRLNQLGKNDIIIVDELGKDEKWKNLVKLDYIDFQNKWDFLDKVEKNLINYKIEAIIHMGANSSTTEKDADHLISNNYEYTKKLASYAVKNSIRFIYASSAATYGDGALGFNDRNDEGLKLKPLNMYGYSKNLFDIRAYKKGLLDKIVGLKYFNVYGPNESHKGDMRSVVHKAFEQVRDFGYVKLFKSANPEYKDGEQMRDFVYVKDAVEMTLYFLNHPNVNGLFNVGSGQARSWNALVTSLFIALDKPVNIQYIEMPEHLKEKYQYFTQADISKIRSAGYAKRLYTLEEGIADYVRNYLVKGVYLGE